MRSAREQAAAIREREVSAVETMQHHLDAIAAHEPQLGAIVNAIPAGRRARAGARRRRRRRRRRAARPAARAADRGQGRDGRRRAADDRGRRPAPGPDRDARLAARRAAARGRGADHRQDEHARARPRHAHLQRPLRPDPQPLRARPPRRRLQRRCGGGGRGRAAAARRRLRLGRIAALPGGVLQRRRAAAVAGADPSSRPDDGWSPHGVLGPIARDVRRRRAAAVRDRRPRRPHADRARRGPGGVRDARQPSDLRGVRVAWSWDLDGLPIDAEVQRVLGEMRAALVDAGCVVEDVEPDLSGADEAWETIEMLGFLAFCGARRGASTATRCATTSSATSSRAGR